MPEQVSNRRVLYTFLLLGVVLLPSLGIIPAGVAPKEGRDGEPVSMTALVTFPAVFIAAGAAITVYALRRCPVCFVFDDTLTVRYLIHERVIPRDQIVGASSRSRMSTIGGRGSIR